jgi:16S rRNA (adenine1518-N6/adenine1519-N6)-dimethyltransferase
VRSLGPRETRALLERYGIGPKTSIGQHFVTDPNTVRKIVSLAGIEPGDRVIEVGPGLGALTLALVEAGADVVAVEADRRLEPVLAEVVPEVQVVWADAMRIDPARLAGRRAAVVANLPYQIATPLVVEWLAVPAIRSFTVMVQREVGERIVAGPGTDPYGAVSVKVAYFGDARIAARVSRRVFLPMPEVESVVVRIDRRPRPPVSGAREKIFQVIETGFAQRRKTVRRALRARWGADQVEQALVRARVDGGARAETLSLGDFAALARALPA